MSKVAIVVVTYNRLNLLKECISSLRCQSFKDRDIIVVNNGSTDGSEEWLKSQSDIILISQSNQGGAGGFYTGLKYSCENHYCYSWIMDDDTIPSEDSLLELMLKANSSIGFLCSKVIDINNEVCNVPSIDYQKLDNGEVCWPERLNEALVRVRTATFVSVLFHNKIIHEVGLPIKEYFIWGDDLEYTRRISKKYPCYICGKSIVLHKRALNGILSISNETNPNRIRNFYYAYRNGILNAKKESTRDYFFTLSKTIGIGAYLFLKGKFKKSCIIFKSILSSFAFNPPIEYPK